MPAPLTPQGGSRPDDPDYVRSMSENYSSDQLDAVQNVVDRVSSYQETAPESTVVAQLQAGLQETGVAVDEAGVRRLADAIESHDDSNGSSVSAAEVLG